MSGRRGKPFKLVTAALCGQSSRCSRGDDTETETKHTSPKGSKFAARNNAAAQGRHQSCSVGREVTETETQTETQTDSERDTERDTDRERQR